MRGLGVAALCAAGVLAVAGQASAADYLATFTGVLASGTDNTGVFGFAPGTDLTGDAFTAEYRFSADGSQSIPGALGHPVDYAKLTINGVTYNILEGASVPLLVGGTILIQDNFWGILADESGQGGSFPFATSVDNLIVFTAAIPTPPAVFTDTPAWDGLLGGNFHISYRVGSQTQAVIFNQDANGVFADVSGTISLVPEPDTWALLIVGFGGIGAALRRRRTVIA